MTVSGTLPPVLQSETSLEDAPLRVLVFADTFGASQSLAFVEGLGQSRAAGHAVVEIVTEAQAFDVGEPGAPESVDAIVEAAFERFRPTHPVVSRLGSAAVWNAVQAAARRRDLPIVFHIDDDLFDMPVVVGIERYRQARHPRRIATLENILRSADLTLVSTPTLAARLQARAEHERFAVLANGTAGEPRPRIPKPANGGELVIGYMGSASHNSDLAMVAPALNTILKANPHVSVSLFGSIASQPAANLIEGKVTRLKPVTGDYRAFKAKLAELAFDIGLAPLRDNAFNRAKTATKWVEYAEAGVPTLASNIPPYRSIVAAGAAVGVTDVGWAEALTRMIRVSDLRRRTVEAADAFLGSQYSWARLEASVLAALRHVGASVAAA